jgi:outer membrane protein assembly factor BamB
MKKTRIYSLLALAAAALLLAACGSAPTAASWPGITVDEASGTVYVAYGQHVYALQEANGTQQWRFPAERENNLTIYSAPTLTQDGQLIFGSYNHALYSVDPQSGTLNWSFAGASNRYIGSPSASDNGVFASNADGKLYALNANGQLQWTFGSQQPQWSKPIEEAGGLFVPSLDHHLYYVDSLTGQELWNADLGGTLVSDVAYGDSVAFIGTLNSEIIAVDIANGDIVWRTTTDGWVWGTPTLFDGRVYVGDLEGVLYALEPTTGAEYWRLDTGGPITGSPLIVDDQIYVINETGNVLSISLEGRTTWTKTFDAELYGSAVAAGDLVLFGQSNHTTLLVALDHNGDTVWSFTPEN